MERTERIALLEQVRSGALSPAEAEALLAPPAFEDLGYAKVDHHRARRQKAAEVIFGQGKDPGQIEGIVRSMADRPGRRKRLCGGSSPMTTAPPPVSPWPTPRPIR